ncbi:MAG: hypothetical protein EA376_02030 [Phycisphaeraceae bacterium]|nr:MAG: hypothetical protein EA376_02030 [Phycisphaeraceae bacterium]
MIPRVAPSSPHRVGADRAPVITGLGLVTPLGLGAWQTASALLAGRTTADRLAELPEDTDPVSLARATGGSAFGAFSAVDPAVDLAERAAREALYDAGLDPGAAPCIVASSKGAVMALLDERRPERRAACAAMSPHGYLCHHLRERVGLAEARSVVAACATGIAALHHAWREIVDGRAERVLVVAVESALHPLFVWSYRRLGVLAPTPPGAAAQEHVARPLDRRRNGFTLCECAAAVMIESSEASTRRRAKHVHGRLLGAAMGSHAFDMVRSPERFDTLTRLARAVTPAETPISLLHPHATGTQDNDERELAALAAALGERTRETPVYAAKGAFGHPLGAAGVVNAVLGCLFARIGERPPMPWLDEPIECAFPLAREKSMVAPGAQLCVAAGFGGHVGAVCFSAGD